MNQINISEYTIIHDVPPPLPVGSRCAIDTEWTNMDKKKLHRPTGEFACATFYFGTNEVYIVEDVRRLAEAFQNIEKAGWIFHNAKFDIFHLRRLLVIPQRRLLWDIMLVEQVRYNGRYEEFNLAALYRRYCNGFMDKETRKEFAEWSGEMSHEQVNYACSDTIATYEIFQVQRSEIDTDDLKVWKTIELPYMWCILGKRGISINTAKWLELAQTNKDQAELVQIKYGKQVTRLHKKTGKPCKTMVWDGMNLNSDKQVLNQLHKLGYKDLDSTGEKIIQHLYEKEPFVKDLLDFRMYDTRSTKYGFEWFNSWVEPDGKVYPDIFQREAETGRSSSRNPNGQNIPAKDTLEFRECFIPDPGNVLVDIDYGSQEPRVAAEFTQDPSLLAIFSSGKDIYVEVARIAFGEVIEKKDPRRKKMKDLTLASFYGKTKWGLSRDLEISLEEAEDMLKKFHAAFPLVDERYVQVKYKQAQDYGYVTTLSGAKLWVNLYTNQWRNNAVNSPIQGTSAEMLKVSVYESTVAWCGENFYTNIPFIIPVHDEALSEYKTEDAQAALEQASAIMLDVAQRFHPSVPAQVEAKICNNWAEAK